MELVIKLDTLQESAHHFWKQMKDGDRLFAFHGEMGMGKTSFIAALCAEKGVTGNVSSPTFSLINEYHYSENSKPRRIFHIDLFRIKNEEEAIQSGIEECLYSIELCFVEWPERIPSLLPEKRVDIFMYFVDNNTRLLKINFHR